MRLSRIIMALTVGLAVAAVPTAAGAAQPQPDASATTDPTATAAVPADRRVADCQPTDHRLGETFTLTGTTSRRTRRSDIVVTVTGRWPLRPAEGLRPGAATAAPWRWRRSPTRPSRAPPHFTAYHRRPAATSPSPTARPAGPLHVHRHRLTSGLIASATGTVLPPRLTKSAHRGGLPVTGDSIGTPHEARWRPRRRRCGAAAASLAWRRRQRFGGAAH